MKKVNFARIIQRLVQRFKLTRSVDEELTLQEVIVPTTDIDSMLRSLKTGILSTTGTDVTHVFTVPAGKRWVLKAISWIRTITGTASVLLVNIDESFVYITQNATALTGDANTKLNDISIDEGWSVWVVHGTSASNDMDTQLLYEEEDAF